MVAPIVHKDRASIAKLFSEYFGTPYDDDPHALTMQARKYLRDKFRSADFGMTGGNFLVAETGHLCCVENEGNQRQSVTTPRVLVSLVGIEKVVPRLTELYCWSADELRIPDLTDLVRGATPTYAWDPLDWEPWAPPATRLVRAVRRALPSPRRAPKAAG